MLVEQLGSHLKELKSLENAGSMDEAWSILSKLLAAQEHEPKEIEEQMAEEAPISSTSKPITKDWLAIQRNPKSSSKVQSKLSPLLILLLLRHKLD